ITHPYLREMSGEQRDVAPSIDVVPCRAEHVPRAGAPKPCDGFAQHVGASPGDRAKDLRHRATHADQVVSAVEAWRDYHWSAPQQRDASREQPRRERWRVGAEKHCATGAIW